MRPRHAVLAAVLALLLIPAGAQGDTVLGEVFDDTPISAYGSLTAWSVDQGDGSFHLMVHDGQAVRPVPVEPRSVPFDVDLGPGPDGGVVAAYSRCAEEPGRFASYTAGRECDVYRYSFSDGEEERLEGASTDQASEMLPSIWRGEVAFARVYEEREGRRDGYELDELPYLYIRALDGESGSRRQPLETRGRSGMPGPIAIDLYGRRLGFAWQYQGNGETAAYTMRLVTGGQPEPGRIASTGEGGLSASFFLSADFDRGRLFFAGECFGDPGGCGDAGLRRKLYRYRISTGELDGALIGSDQLLAATRAGGEAFYVRAARTGSSQQPNRCSTRLLGDEPGVFCEVLRSDPLTFRDDLPGLDNIEP